MREHSPYILHIHLISVFLFSLLTPSSKGVKVSDSKEKGLKTEVSRLTILRPKEDHFSSGGVPLEEPL